MTFEWKLTAKKVPCPKCGGSGELSKSLKNILDNVSGVKCKWCEGLGYIYHLPDNRFKAESGLYRAEDVR